MGAAFSHRRGRGQQPLARTQRARALRAPSAGVALLLPDRGRNAETRAHRTLPNGRRARTCTRALGRAGSMNEAANPRILCVDDEQRVLEGLERTLFDHFEVVTLSKPEQAL